MAFLGMRGTGSWTGSERPENWRETILYLYPNGMAPLTAILSKMKSESVNDPHYHWFTKTLPLQRATITGVYTDAAMLNAYVANGVAGQTLFVKVAEVEAKEFRAGHVVMLRDADDLAVDCVARVQSVIINGANSMISCMLLEADDNSANHDCSDVDTLLVIGNSNPEGAEMPDSISYDVSEWFNYTQIFRTPLEITRTARKTRLRTKPQYQESKREALELHSIEMEKAFLWGIRTLRTGSNGQPERTTLGVINAIRTGAPANVFNFATDPAYAGQTWLQGGADWLDVCLEQVFRYGANEKLALIGSGAQLAIDRLAKTGANFNLTPGDSRVTWGISVVRWLTSFGTINLVSAPLFNYEPTNRNAFVLLEPRLLTYKYVDDTEFFGEGGKTAPEGHGFGRIDGTKEEYLTECGLEYHHPQTMGLFSIGVDNNLP
jgi:hypothetical protein